MIEIVFSKCTSLNCRRKEQSSYFTINRKQQMLKFRKLLAIQAAVELSLHSMQPQAQKTFYLRITMKIRLWCHDKLQLGKTSTLYYKNPRAHRFCNQNKNIRICNRTSTSTLGIKKTKSRLFKINIKPRL